MKSIQAVLLACIAAALFGVSQANYVEIGTGLCLDKDGIEYPGASFVLNQSTGDLAECKQKCGCAQDVSGVRYRGLNFGLGLGSYNCICFVDWLDPVADAAVIDNLRTKCDAAGANFGYFDNNGFATGSGDITSTSDGDANLTCYRKKDEGSYSMSYSSKGGKSGGGSSKGGKGGSSMSYGSYLGKASKSSSKGGKGGSSMSYAYGGKGGKRE